MEKLDQKWSPNFFLKWKMDQDQSSFKLILIQNKMQMILVTYPIHVLFDLNKIMIPSITATCRMILGPKERTWEKLTTSTEQSTCQNNPMFYLQIDPKGVIHCGHLSKIVFEKWKLWFSNDLLFITKLSGFKPTTNEKWKKFLHQCCRIIVKYHLGHFFPPS